MTVYLPVRHYCTRARFTVLVSCNDEIAVRSCPLLCLQTGFLLRWNISVIFAEKFWSLKHFDHLSHSCIKTHHNSVFSLYFQTFSPKWLNFFRSFQKRFSLWPKKTACRARLWSRYSNYRLRLRTSQFFGSVTIWCKKS